VATQTSGGPAAAIVLFTRDLRVHDHPALVAASRAARVVPLFVLDDAILSRPYAAPNRLVALLEALADLRASLRALGSDLVVRRGRPAAVVAELLGQLTSTATGTAGGNGTGGVAVHCSADVSAFARAREADDLGALARQLGLGGVGHLPRGGGRVLNRTTSIPRASSARTSRQKKIWVCPGNWGTR
jgi:deoxyribodipyrimidine photo-lyase